MNLGITLASDSTVSSSFALPHPHPPTHSLSFSLAHSLPSTPHSFLLFSSFFIFLLCPVAPEVLRKQSYGVAADVFSFAIVLCELICGELHTHLYTHRYTSVHIEIYTFRWRRRLLAGIDPVGVESNPGMSEEKKRDATAIGKQWKALFMIPRIHFTSAGEFPLVE